jgi:hypothetical protein
MIERDGRGAIEFVIKRCVRQEVSLKINQCESNGGSSLECYRRIKRSPFRVDDHFSVGVF